MTVATGEPGRILSRDAQGRVLVSRERRAHARRGFYEALDHAPKEAGWILIQIGHLVISTTSKEDYAVNRRAQRCEMLIAPGRACPFATGSIGSCNGGT